MIGRVIEIMGEMSRIVRRNQPHVRYKELHGGPFNFGQYAIGTLLTESRGLHCLMYFVARLDCCGVIGFASTREEATQQARDMLSKVPRDTLSNYFAALRAEIDSAKRQLEMEREVDRAARRPASVKSIPKRRREIFDKAEGKCHYCATPLTLDGKWHIEHMQPRALLGPNDKSNLVAACVPCNMKKRDSTAEEFIASRSA